MNPIGPSEFQVSVLRLQLRFVCQGDAILFTEIRAATQEDIDAFSRCFGQQPQLTSDGQMVVASASISPEPSALTEEQSVSVVDSMREQLSQISQQPEKEKTDKPKDKEEAKKAVEEQKGGSSEFELFV
jgi:hypothetical protein